MSDLPVALLELSPDLLGVFSAAGRVEQVNQRWTDVLGWAEHEVVGHSFFELVHPDDLAATAALDGQVGGFANRYRVKSGGWRWLLWETRALEDGRWLCSGRDITAERQTQRDLDALRRVATTVARSRSADETFASVAREVAGVTEAEASAVLRRVGDRLEIVALWPAEGWRTLRVGDLLEQPPEPWLTAPIEVDGRAWGLVAAAHPSGDGLGGPIGERLEELAALTVIAIANADARAALERRALTDSLTGLLNHRAFHDQLAGAVARATRYRHPLSVALLDIDRFKTINDRHGHHAGDGVLQAFADAARENQRECDVLGRLGGDEFAIALPQTPLAGARDAIERLRVAVVGSEPGFTFSAGVCQLASGEDADGLMRRADALLYKSKRAGRARISSVAPPVV